MARGYLPKYTTYVFKDQDPIIDALRTARTDAKMSYTQVSEASKVSKSTVNNWENGRTKRPQFATVVAVARACGKTGVMFDSKGQPHLVNVTFKR